MNVTTKSTTRSSDGVQDIGGGSIVEGSRLGRYQVARFLGRGGMGEVYEVEEEGTHGRFALKIITNELREDEKARELFRREGREASGFDHPNIIRVDESGELEGRMYIRMELIGGRRVGEASCTTLADFIIAKDRRVPPDDAIPILYDILGGLSYAHGRRRVHRDIKPSNILLTADRAKIGDFGLVMAGARPGGDMSQMSEVVVVGYGAQSVISSTQMFGPSSGAGTPDYMAPELLSGSVEANYSTDVYSVGILLLEMLTGSRRVGAAKPSQLLRKHYRIDPWWDQLYEKSTAYHEDRFANALEMRAFFEQSAGPAIRSIEVAASRSKPTSRRKDPPPQSKQGGTRIGTDSATGQEPVAPPPLQETEQSRQPPAAVVASPPVVSPLVAPPVVPPPRATPVVDPPPALVPVSDLVPPMLEVCEVADGILCCSRNPNLPATHQSIGGCRAVIQCAGRFNVASLRTTRLSGKDSTGLLFCPDCSARCEPIPPPPSGSASLDGMSGVDTDDSSESRSVRGRRRVGPVALACTAAGGVLAVGLGIWLIPKGDGSRGAGSTPTPPPSGVAVVPPKAAGKAPTANQDGTAGKTAESTPGSPAAVPKDSTGIGLSQPPVTKQGTDTTGIPARVPRKLSNSEKHLKDAENLFWARINALDFAEAYAVASKVDDETTRASLVNSHQHLSGLRKELENADGVNAPKDAQEKIDQWQKLKASGRYPLFIPKPELAAIDRLRQEIQKGQQNQKEFDQWTQEAEALIPKAKPSDPEVGIYERLEKTRSDGEERWFSNNGKKSGRENTNETIKRLNSARDRLKEEIGTRKKAVVGLVERGAWQQAQGELDGLREYQGRIRMPLDSAFGSEIEAKVRKGLDELAREEKRRRDVGSYLERNKAYDPSRGEPETPIPEIAPDPEVKELLESIRGRRKNYLAQQSAAQAPPVKESVSAPLSQPASPTPVVPAPQRTQPNNSAPGESWYLLIKEMAFNVNATMTRQSRRETLMMLEEYLQANPSQERDIKKTIGAIREK